MKEIKDETMNPAELYRDYQNGRDNIPNDTYSTLLSKAEAQGHEDAIHSILQEAKSHSNLTQTSAPAAAHGKGALARIFDFIARPSIAAPVFAASLAIVLLPSFLSENANSGFNGAFTDCSDCQAYMASYSTRSIPLTQNRPTPEQQSSAKLGQLVANLMISQEAKLPIDATLAAMQKIPQDLMPLSLSESLNSTNPTATKLINAANSAAELNQTNGYYKLGRDFQVANVMAKHAASNQANTQLANSWSEQHSKLLTSLQELQSESLNVNDLIDRLSATETPYSAISDYQFLSQRIGL